MYGWMYWFIFFLKSLILDIVFSQNLINNKSICGLVYKLIMFWKEHYDF